MKGFLTSFNASFVVNMESNGILDIDQNTSLGVWVSLHKRSYVLKFSLDNPYSRQDSD